MNSRISIYSLRALGALTVLSFVPGVTQAQNTPAVQPPNAGGQGNGLPQPPPGGNQPLQPPPQGGGQPQPKPVSGNPCTFPSNPGVLIFDFSNDRRIGTYKDNVFRPLGHNYTVGANRIVSLRVINVNRFLYDVSLKGNRLDLFRDVPDVFKSNLLPKKTEAKQGENQNANLVPGTPEHFQQAIASFNGSLNALLDVTQLDEVLRGMAMSYRVLDENVIRGIQDTSRSLIANTIKRGLPGQDAEAIQPGSPGQGKPTISDNLAISSAPILQAKPKLIEDVRTNYQLLQTAYNKRREKIDEDEKNDLIMAANDTAKIDAARAKAIAARQEAETLFAAAKERYDKFEAATRPTDSGTASDVDREFTNIVDIYEQIRSCSAFSQIVSVKAGGDFVKFEIDIKPKDGVSGGLAPVKDEITVPVHGNFRINFSAGIAASELTDDSLVLRAQNDPVPGNPGQTQSVTYVRDSGSQSFQYPLAGFAHFYWRASGGWSKFQPAFTLGAASAGNKFQILTGLSFILGGDQRLILTIGRAFGEVTRLRPGFTMDKPVPFQTDDFTYSKTTDAWFFGISWNFQ